MTSIDLPSRIAGRPGRSVSTRPTPTECSRASGGSGSPNASRRPWGRLLDAEAERLGEADVQAFEPEGLIGTRAAAAVLTYLFHRVEGRLYGRPTLLIIDEGWLVLDDP